MWRRLGQALVEATRRYFIAGLLAFAPIGITFWAIAWIITRLDNLLLPKVLEWFAPGLEAPPQAPPLVGLIFTFGVILLAGVIVRHLFGHELVRLWERLLERVPIARSVYSGVKQLVEALLSASSTTSRFSRVVLVEYPRKGVYALAFITGDTRGPVHDAVASGALLNCFVPTTPNPTSGFYLAIPAEDAIEVDLTVEDAFKVIMSAGLVTPAAAGLLRGDRRIGPPVRPPDDAETPPRAQPA